ncbi:MAG: hypothetical protein QW531_00535, partial [Thermoplasmata archaeon]
MPGVGGWLTVEAFFAGSKKRPDGEEPYWFLFPEGFSLPAQRKGPTGKSHAGFFSLKAFLCQLKEKASAEESPHSFSKA